MYTVTEIPGVIKAGQKWKFVWQQAGNNGDGIVGTNDGGLLLAQNDSSEIMKLDKDGKPSVAYPDTHTGGALSINPKGAMFIVERGLHQRIERLRRSGKCSPTLQRRAARLHRRRAQRQRSRQQRRRVLHDGRGVHAPAAACHEYGENLATNGIVLSADEKTLYVTNGQSVAAFDVQPDGSLTNQREFVKLTGGGGDGSTIDSKGRLYVTSNAGVEVIDASGKHLGVIPTPRGVITSRSAARTRRRCSSSRAAARRRRARKSPTSHRYGRFQWRRRASKAARNSKPFVFPSFHPADHLLDGPAEPRETQRGFVGPIAVRSRTVDDEHRLLRISGQGRFHNLAVRQIDRGRQVAARERFRTAHVEQHKIQFAGPGRLERGMHVPAVGLEREERSKVGDRRHGCSGAHCCHR